MANCKEDFLKEIEGKEILCAKIADFNDGWDLDSGNTFLLPVGFTESTYQLFLKAIDFTYDAGYGGQEVYGLIWYKDGTWSERGEYDGSEWWEYKSTPAIPKELQSVSPQPTKNEPNEEG